MNLFNNYYGLELPYIGDTIMKNIFTDNLEKQIWEFLQAAQDMNKNTFDEYFVKEHVISIYCEYIKKTGCEYLRNYIDLSDLANSMFDRYVVDFYRKNIDRLIEKSKV